MGPRVFLSQGKMAGIQSRLLTPSTAEVKNKWSYTSILQGRAIQSRTASPLKKKAVWSSERLETLIQQQSVTSSQTWNLNYTSVRPKNPKDIYLIMTFCTTAVLIGQEFRINNRQLWVRITWKLKHSGYGRQNKLNSSIWVCNVLHFMLSLWSSSPLSSATAPAATGYIPFSSLLCLHAYQSLHLFPGQPMFLMSVLC